jgi:hypothetical protein
MSTCIVRAILADPTHPADCFCHPPFAQEIAVSLFELQALLPTPIHIRLLFISCKEYKYKTIYSFTRNGTTRQRNKQLDETNN